MRDEPAARGVYCENADIAPIVGDASADHQFASRDAAERVWRISEALVAR